MVPQEKPSLGGRNKKKNQMQRQNESRSEVVVKLEQQKGIPDGHLAPSDGLGAQGVPAQTPRRGTDRRILMAKRQMHDSPPREQHHYLL